MSIGEFILTVLVAFVVFGPKKLPMLARDAGLLLARFNRYKVQMIDIWKRQVNELQLQENIRKAEVADAANEEKSALP